MAALEDGEPKLTGPQAPRGLEPQLFLTIYHSVHRGRCLFRIEKKRLENIPSHLCVVALEVILLWDFLNSL